MLTAALIGLGNIAWKYDALKPDSTFALSQAEAIRRHGGIVLGGGCSPDAADRAGFTAWSGGLPTFTDPEEMLAALRPDLVGICSPTLLHFDHARLCLEAGTRLLWLEKPATRTFAESDQLLELARQQQATVCVNYFRRYLPTYRRLADVLQRNEFGACRGLNILYSPGLSRNGVHLLDQLFFLTGACDYEILWVERDAEVDNPGFALRLSTGQLVQGSGGNLAYHSNDITAICAKGTLTLSRGGEAANVQRLAPDPLVPGVYCLRDDDSGVLGTPSLDDYLQASLADLVDCAAHGKEPQSSLTSARMTQRLLEEILYKADA